MRSYDPARQPFMPAEFTFMPGQRPKFVREMQRIVDRDGTQAEQRFRAVLALGERLQSDMVEHPERARATLVRRALADVLEEFSLSDEKELRRLLRQHWAYAPEFSATLEDTLSDRVDAGLRVKVVPVRQHWRNTGTTLVHDLSQDFPVPEDYSAYKPFG